MTQDWLRSRYLGRLASLGGLGLGLIFVVVFQAIWLKLMRNIYVWQGEFCNRKTNDSIARETVAGRAAEFTDAWWEHLLGWRRGLGEPDT